MNITYIKIENFRNVERIELYPSPYVNIITGDNGSGKSSLLYALMYAITDKLPEKLSNYIMWGKDYFFIEIHFIYLSNQYQLKVKHDGNKTLKELWCHTNDVYYNSEATKYLQTLFNTNLIYYSLFSEQGKTAQILFDTPANRLKKLKEILNIDSLNDICTVLKEDIDVLKQDSIKIETQLKLAKEKTFTLHEVPILPDITSIQQQFTALENEKNNYYITLQKYQQYLHAKENYTMYCMQKNEINSTIQSIVQDITTLQQTLQTMQDVNGDIEHIQHKLQELQKQKTELEKVIYTYQEKNKILQQYIYQKQQKEKELEQYPIKRIQKIDFDENYLQQLFQKSNELQYTIQDIENKIALVQQGKCPTCGRDFNNYNIQELLQVLQTLQKDKENVDNEYISKKNIYEIYKKAVLQNEEYTYKRTTIGQMITDINTAIMNLQQELQTINIDEISSQYTSGVEQIQSCNQTLQELIQTQKQKDEYQIILQQKQTLLQTYNNKLLSLDKQYEGYIQEPTPQEEPIKYNEVLYNALQKQLQEYEALKTKHDMIVELNNTIINEKNKNEQLIQELQQKYDDITKQINVFKECYTLLDKQFSSYLIDTGAQYLKEYMNKFFISTYGKYEITFSQDKNSIDFYFGDGETFTSCAMASGFEKSCLAIALRVALANLIPTFTIMILDEVDSDASTNNSIQLYTMLLQFLPQYQFFIVTHIDETKEFLLQNYQTNFYTIHNGILITN